MENHKLDVLGICLSLSRIKRMKIKGNFHSHFQRREAYLDHYVTNHPCPSWSQVAQALRVGADLSSQADMVENTYVQGKINAHMYTYGCSELQTHVPSMHIQDIVITLLACCPY